MNNIDLKTILEKHKMWLNDEDGGEMADLRLANLSGAKCTHDYIYGKAEIRFVKGRLKFGGSTNSAPFPSMVVIFREKEAVDGETY